MYNQIAGFIVCVCSVNVGWISRILSHSHWSSALPCICSSICLSGGLFIREWIWIYKETNFRILIVFYCTVELCVCDFGLYSLTVRTWIIKNRTVQNIQNILWLCSMKHVWMEFMPRSSNKNHKVSMCVPSLLLLLFRRLTLSMPFVASTTSEQSNFGEELEYTQMNMWVGWDSEW